MGQRRTSGGYFLQRPPPPPLPPPRLLLGIKLRTNRSCHSPESSSRADLYSRFYRRHSHTACSSHFEPDSYSVPERLYLLFLHGRSLFPSDPFGFYALINLPRTSGALCPGRSVPTRHGALLSVVSPAVCISADGE